MQLRAPLVPSPAGRAAVAAVRGFLGEPGPDIFLAPAMEAARAVVEATKTDNSWGNQIRSYVFQPYTMVNDHRTEVKVGDVQRVMDGDLDPFIEAYLKRFGGKAA